MDLRRRLAGYSMARITRALNDAGDPSPGRRNPDVTRTAGIHVDVDRGRAILANPRYTGRQVWNRQRTDHELVDPENTRLDHRPCSAGTCARWIISARPAHPATVSEADFVRVQASLRRGPATPGRRTCSPGCSPAARAGGAWSRAGNGKPPTGAARPPSATPPDRDRPENAYIREDQILPRLPALAILLGAPAQAPSGPGQGAGPPRTCGRCGDRVPAAPAHHAYLRPQRPRPPRRNPGRRGSHPRPQP